MKKLLLLSVLASTLITVYSQPCTCEQEFKHAKNLIEQSFAGYPDKVKALTPKVYQAKVRQFEEQSRSRFASDNCPLIIEQYLSLFKSNHLGISLRYDYGRLDTAFAAQRPTYALTEAKLAALKSSRSWEGIYYFGADSTTKIAVIHDPTPLHDYIGVVIESTRPYWKKGLIKWEGKKQNDSLLRGLLYMRNHRPKFEYFSLWNHNDMIGGDWRREGTPIRTVNYPANTGKRYRTIDAESLDPQTFYIRIGSFGLNHKRAIDSLLQVNEQLLSKTPYLILDLRDNGGGGDESYEKLIPLLYTNPIKEIGANTRLSDTTISLYRKWSTDNSLPPATKASITQLVGRMEKAKGAWMRQNEDNIIDKYQPLPYPQKIVVFINRYCGSTTEEFLLAARQSSKVILVGENTNGNLDYSNMVSLPLSCLPYTLSYATTRSRRLDIGQGIDNVGIAPHHKIAENADWIQETKKILDKQ